MTDGVTDAFCICLSVTLGGTHTLSLPTFPWPTSSGVVTLVSRCVTLGDRCELICHPSVTLSVTLPHTKKPPLGAAAVGCFCQPCWSERDVQLELVLHFASVNFCPTTPAQKADAAEAALLLTADLDSGFLDARLGREVPPESHF